MARLGTSKKPIFARVQTEVRAGELADLCERNGWKFTIGIEPDKPEDISDILKMEEKVERMRRPRPTFIPRYGRNDFCPCGSGQKYKKCCWDKDHPERTADK